MEKKIKILLPVIGVRGDVQIFLALARALSDQGYETTIAVNEKFRILAESYGINCYSLKGNPDDGINEMQEIMNAKTTMEAVKIGMNFFFKGIMEQTKTLQELCPDYDLIVGYGSFGLAEADKANKPFISVIIDPAMAGKKFSKNMKLNLNLIVERIALYFLMGREYEKFRKEIGASSSSESNNPKMIILPMSQHVVMPENNWTSMNVISGYWYIDTHSNYSPPKYLQEFIESGEKPIFISFGSASWGEEDNTSLLNILFEGVQKAGVRAIILNTKSYDGKVPDYIYLVQEIPYNWLLSNVSCVVHHCGLGTTAEALREGLISVPVPHMIDQFAWARRIHSCGVATRPIPRKELTAEKLSKAIKQALTNTIMKENAKKLGHKIKKENGLKNAVIAIESVLNKNNHH